MPLLSVEEAAVHLKVSRSFLDKKRVSGGGPRYYKLSPKKVLYDTNDLDAWKEERARRHTGPAGEEQPPSRRQRKRRAA